MRGRELACAVLLSASCVRADPNHCANKDGDLTCQEGGHGQFCSACAGPNFGCVDEAPDDVCHVFGPSSGSSSSGGSASESGSESGSGPAPTCTLEGAIDPECPESQPYCIDGACGTCDLAEADFCSGLDAATPACHADWGLCVGCTDDSACSGANAWCGHDFTCTGCFEHAHCPASACDLEYGECMDGDVVAHVNNAVCPDNGAGTEAAPYCSLAIGIQQIPEGGRGTVILHGGTSVYDEGLLLTTNGPRTVAVIGVDEPTIIVPGNGSAATVSNGMSLYVSRVRLSTGAGTGVECNGELAMVWLDDLSIYNNVDAVVLDGCTARMRRIRVINNEGHGVRVENEADLRIESSIIANNGADYGIVSGVYVDASTIDIRYTTIANNVSMRSGPNVYCVAGGGGPIRNSLVLAPGLDSLNCPWAEVYFSVHDNASPPTGGDNYDVEVFDETWFQDVGTADFHVRGAMSSLFRDRASWQLGDPIVDFEGDPRAAYPGASGFAGADEP